jgi:hypothetical protein
MKAELQALRELTGLNAPSKRSQRKYDLSELGLARANQQLATLIVQMAQRGLGEVMSFCFVGRKLNEKGLQIAMRRFVAVAWMLHSELLVGAETDERGEPIPLSLAELGKIPQLDCTKVALSLLAKRFGAMFKFQSRMQKRQGTKVNYAASAKIGWDKRRARIKSRKAAAAAKRRTRKRTKK